MIMNINMLEDNKYTIYYKFYDYLIAKHKKDKVNENLFITIMLSNYPLKVDDNKFESLLQLFEFILDYIEINIKDSNTSKYLNPLIDQIINVFIKNNIKKI